MYFLISWCPLLPWNSHSSFSLQNAAITFDNFILLWLQTAVPLRNHSFFSEQRLRYRLIIIFAKWFWLPGTFWFIFKHAYGFPAPMDFAACAFIVKGTKICAIRRNSPCANARQLFVSRREETLSTNSKCCYLVPFGCLRADGGRETWQNSGFKESEELGTGEKVWSRKNVSTSKCQWWENVHGRVDASPHHWKWGNLNSARSGQYVCLFLPFQSSPIQFKLGGHTNTDMHTRCER